MSNEKLNKNLAVFGWIVVAVAIICSLTLWGQRLSSEKDYNKIQISVNYTDVVSMANANGLSNEALAQMLKSRGVSALLFKEISVGDLQRQGKVAIAVGHNLENAPYFAQVSDEVPITDADLFVAILDEQYLEQVRDHVLLKIVGSQFYDGEVAVIKVPIAIPSSISELDQFSRVVTEIGVGFDQQGLALAEECGLGVIPQVRTWFDASDEALRFMTDELKAMPNLCQILFNDKEIPSGIEQERIRVLADLLKVDGKAIAPIGTIEFSEQAGLNTLGILLDKEVIRLHTIANNEMSRLDYDEVMDRWLLAARERNMRSLLVRFMDINMPGIGLEENLAYLEDLKDNLEAAGFELTGEYQRLAPIEANQTVLLLVGLGVAAGVLLILVKMNLPRLGVAGFALTALCWIGLSSVSPILACKLMALAGVIIFPILSCIIVITPERHRVFGAVFHLLKMSAISFIGAILMVGLLANVLFMVKLDQFIGVKIAHIIPIAVVPVVLYIWQEKDPISAVREILEKAVTYKWGLLAAVIAVAGVIYISRTGNTAAELSGLEAAMRSFLNDVLGVRPRSKEFLIGYPLTLLMFYYGATKGKWFLTIPAVIGQVSLVNTYAHIHTALLISLQRSLNGLILGIILGIIAIGVMELVLKVWHKVIEKG